jgi:hypothetical protein
LFSIYDGWHWSLQFAQPIGLSVLDLSVSKFMLC